MKTISIRLSDEAYAVLKLHKEDVGLTWSQYLCFLQIGKIRHTMECPLPGATEKPVRLTRHGDGEYRHLRVLREELPE